MNAGKKNIVSENYNAITGEVGEKGKASDPFYHWGALLVYMAVERIVNFNEWTDEVEFNDIPSCLNGLRNLPLKNSTVNIP